MHDLAPLIFDLALMLGLAAVVTVLFQYIHQPIVLGYLIAGIIVGPYAPPHGLVTDIPNIQILSELGVIFLMFSIGLEFSFNKLTRVGFSATITGLFEVCLMIPIGFMVGKLLAWNYFDSLFLGAALSISSTTIIIKAIEELGLKTKKFATLILGILIVEDLIAILLLAGLSTLVLTQNIFSANMLYATIKLIIVVGAWFLLGYFLVPPLFRRIAKFLSQETLTIVSIALCLILVCIANIFHYSSALGAFIMGSILAETVLIRRIEDLIKPIRDIFAAVFFISVGILINPYVIIAEWPTVLFISVITILGKIILTSGAALLSGQTIKTSLRSGFSMAQIGEFSFIIIGFGMTLGVISNKLYPIIVAVSALTTFTTPYLIRASIKISNTIDQKTPQKFKLVLQNYSGWIYRLSNTSTPSIFRVIFMRLLMNAIVVAIIFTFVDQIIYREILNYIPDTTISNLLALFLAITLASPFIWGMLFSYRVKTLPIYTEHKTNPIVPIIWVITLTQIAVMSIAYFDTWLVVLIFLVITIVFFTVSFKQLEQSYHWFETQLLTNIGVEKATKLGKYDELAPWETNLVELEVNAHSSLNGESLKKIKVREKYGVNIVGIIRHGKLLPSPRGEDIIKVYDKLIVLGDDDQISSLEKALEGEKQKYIEDYVIDHFALRAIVIHPESNIIGKTIRETQIREKVNGIVVGLERDQRRILNPEPEKKLQAYDILFVVGEISKFKRLKM